MLAGENVSALARELKVLRKDLYVWHDRFRSGGPDALRGRGRPLSLNSRLKAQIVFLDISPPIEDLSPYFSCLTFGVHSRPLSLGWRN